MTNEPGSVPTPGEFIVAELKIRGWTQEDLARIIDRPPPRITGLIQGKIPISPEWAMLLGMAFDNAPEEWLRRDATYKLSLTDVDAENVRRRARVYSIAPIKEMQKRGWLSDTEDPLELEAELKHFFGISDLSEEPEFAAHFRKSATYTENTNPQKAWLGRVRQIARSVSVGRFDSESVSACEERLRKLAAFPQEARKVSAVFAKHGVRFIVVEPLKGTKIDGATLWLDDKSPVIAVSLRHDRIDSAWFTIGHEWSHVKNKDTFSVDCELAEPERTMIAGRPAFEVRADKEAAALLIQPNELESFIKRVGPLYSEDRIVQFANRIKIHPGIIVGQLQFRGQIGWHANRKWLVSVRDTIASTSITDGWGKSIGGTSLK